MTKDKIVTYEQLRKMAASFKTGCETVVFRSGCFDILHIGHIKTLEKDKEIGTRLVVGVGMDSNISANKRKPLYDQYNRAYMLASLTCVDHVIILDEPSIKNVDHHKILEILKPDYWHIPTDDISIGYKKQVASKLGINLVVLPLISVSNFDRIEEPHSSDIVKHEL